jgi:hypothetical protein
MTVAESMATLGVTTLLERKIYPHYSGAGHRWICPVADEQEFLALGPHGKLTASSPFLNLESMVTPKKQ